MKKDCLVHHGKSHSRLTSLAKQCTVCPSLWKQMKTKLTRSLFLVERPTTATKDFCGLFKLNKRRFEALNDKKLSGPQKDAETHNEQKAA